MTSAQTEGLIGMLIVLGILVLLVLPSVIGIVHDKRVDRQIRKAREYRTAHGATRTV
jgi:competence protein ComGC